ncbi:MAG: PDZ domain-containing protein [candidate division WOR-3 bacterium]|nr:MAG: PDZ domain-containing protein [candidate division WOR-3 bacterium]
MRIVIALVAIVMPLSMSGDTEMVGYLGLSTQDLTDAMKVAFDVDHGLLVDRVYHASPAEEADIEVGDIILKIDDNEIEDFRVLKHIVHKNPDKRVNVSLLRRGSKISKTVTLGAKEKSRICIDIDIPEIPDFHVMLGTKELQDNIAELRAELQDLKRELEEIKKELK